jgi:hypothetical protein
LGGDKRPEGVDPPVGLVLLGRDLRDRAEGAAAGIVEQHGGVAEVPANGPKRCSDLSAIADITTESQHSGPALSDLAGEGLQILRFPREHGDRIGRSEAADERSS